MPDAQEDLRATSEALQADAELLATLEETKRTLDPTDPQLVEISRRVEGLTRTMVHKATAERELSEEVHHS